MNPRKAEAGYTTLVLRGATNGALVNHIEHYFKDPTSYSALQNWAYTTKV